MDFVDWTWTPTGSNTADGIRAPIWFRRDGLLCDNTAMDATLSNWIAIEGTGGADAIVQIGYLHEWISGVSKWCRFYEDPSVLPQVYNCSDTDDKYVYFRIEVGSSTYQVSDCGTEGDFDNCTQEDSYGPLFTSPTAAVASEAHDSCTVYMMGQTSDPVTYGNSNWHVDVEDNSGWARRGWNFGGPTCTNGYSGSGYTDGLETWDTRNTS